MTTFTRPAQTACSGLNAVKLGSAVAGDFTHQPIQWKYTPDQWPSRFSMWLARHDNLPPGCLAKHLGRILCKI